jgi:quinol monooxygenase YgiN
MRAELLSPSVRMTVKWFVPPHESERITAALHALMVEARTEPGYVTCHLSTVMGKQAGLRYVEEWNGELDLKRQLRSARFARLAELIERGVERPMVEFTLPGGIRGLDYVEEVRLGGIP